MHETLHPERPRDAAAAVPAGGDPTPADLLDLYRALVLPRLVEEKMLRLLRQGRLSKWFSGIGQEAIAVGVASALADDDWILPMHRNLGVFTSRGVDLRVLFRQLLGREGGLTKGRDRTFHVGVPEHHIVGMISHLGAMLPVATGLALAARLREEPRVAAAFTGDGATSEGDFHEALNLAAVWKLPVLFIVENNQYGLSTPAAEQYACAHLADRGAGYGMPGVVCDGNDVIAVRHAVREAAARARCGDGPSLLEFQTFRMRGHEEASGTDYVPDALVETWAGRDPIRRLEHVLDARGVVPPVEPEAAAVEAARETRYVDAISDALREVMRRGSDVVLLGQDIAEYGGVFKVTEGFVEEFGKARVRNTPIIESGAIGAALGLALDGFRPMVEMQFGDFISCGFNQIVNNLAKTHYRWGAGVPVVIRAPVGGGLGAGPFHSQNVEAWFTNVAGLKVVAPATPFDAKGLLIAAFEDGNPVVFLEHKLLYRSVKGRVPDGYYTVPIGRARLAREGRDATVVTWGVGVHWALDAAARLHEEGREIEIVDLRTLAPWDVETAVTSARRTSRVLVLHEAPLSGGFGGEVAATVGRDAFEWLDAPVSRLAALDTPVPFSKALEEIFSPKARVLPALRELLAY
jgi:2-oxoisovalerate dehydrogenase E1 component